MSLLLTVLICTHNRAQLLGNTLASINTARRPLGWEIDIFVVANACQDGTHMLLDAYQRRGSAQGDLPLTWIVEPDPGKSKALNTALPRITTDIVTFVDDDHRVDSNYLAAICEAAETYTQADLFCGRILPDWDGSEPDWVHDNGPYRIYPLPVPRFDQGNVSCELHPDIAVPGGGNLAIRTSWIEKIGPFRTEMGPTGHDLGGAEDLDWVLRAFGLGARLRYVPNMVQYHFVDATRLTIVYLMKKAYKRTASTVNLREPGKVQKVPKYLYRKIIGYVIKSCIAINIKKRRFYLVRSAAAVGELAGYIQLKRRVAGEFLR